MNGYWYFNLIFCNPNPTIITLKGKVTEPNELLINIQILTGELHNIFLVYTKFIK
ncbi:hypothetical protein NBRC116592_06690 [Colwellia sp. KU-HH00111]